jgi:hypothetical protein
MGFYGTGLIHLIGGLAKSATSIMRQLIDAGTLSNLPAGLKAKGMRIKGDNTPLMPGEWRDVDVPGGTIRDSLFPLPYKEPSGVLYQLLGNVVEEGRRIGSVADVQVGNMNPEAPVGTTLALLERSMKVMSGVQARLHAAMKRELRLIARVIHDYMPEQYDYYPDDDFNRVEDFDGRVDVIPVSDPNAATMAQRVVQYQAALQLAQQAPQLYDLGKLHRQMLEVLGIQDAERHHQAARRHQAERPGDGEHGHAQAGAGQSLCLSGPRGAHRRAHGGSSRPQDPADGGSVALRRGHWGGLGRAHHRARCDAVPRRDPETARCRDARPGRGAARGYGARGVASGGRGRRQAAAEKPARGCAASRRAAGHKIRSRRSR